MCFCERFQPPLCGVCGVGVPRSRFPGNLGVETVGVSSHHGLNQTFVRAIPTIPVTRVALLIGIPGLRRDSGEVLSELQYPETAWPNSEGELHWTLPRPLLLTHIVGNRGVSGAWGRFGISYQHSSLLQGLQTRSPSNLRRLKSLYLLYSIA